MNATATYNGNSVEVISKSGGWATILLDSGATRKVRNSALSYAKGTTSEKPVKTKTPKAAKPAKAKKAKAKKAAKAADENDTRLLKPDLSHYVVAPEAPTASGRPSVDIDDETARELRGRDLSEAYRIASVATGETQKALRERYQHLNPGMQRMNLGNLCRGAATKAAKDAEKAKATK